MVWHAVPFNEYPKKGKSIAQTRLQPVVLDMISDDDIEDLRSSVHNREIKLKKIERWTHQAYDQGALLTQLDLAVLLTTSTMSTGQYVREYQNLYNRPLPTRGNVQLIGGGQTHKKQIIALHLKGYLVPTICRKQTTPKMLSGATSVTSNLSDFSHPSSTTSMSSQKSSGSLLLSSNSILTCFLLDS